MLKRLWFIFGPILIAMLLLISVLFLAPAKTSHNLSSEKRAASALTKIVFKNATIKKGALSDPNHRFVPFLALVNGNDLTNCIRLYYLKLIKDPTHHFYLVFKELNH